LVAGSASSTTVAGPSSAEVSEVAVAVISASDVGDAVGRCVELRLPGEPEVVEAVLAAGGQLPAGAGELVEDCERAAVLVPAFVDGVGEGASDEERRCLRDLYLALPPEDAEEIVVAAANPTADGSEQVLANLSVGVEGCLR
jgi:hypothetical protein